MTAASLFEMGFAEQLNEIIGRLPHTRQTLLFSATLPKILACGTFPALGAW